MQVPLKMLIPDKNQIRKRSLSSFDQVADGVQSFDEQHCQLAPKHQPELRTVLKPGQHNCKQAAGFGLNRANMIEMHAF